MNIPGPQVRTNCEPARAIRSAIVRPQSAASGAVTKMWTPPPIVCKSVSEVVPIRLLHPIRVEPENTSVNPHLTACHTTSTHCSDVRGRLSQSAQVADRYQVRSTVLTSQLPVSRWDEQIGDPTLADGILDRLIQNAHRIEMRGDSMRKGRGPKPER